MAITSYATLKTAIESWINRHNTDVTDEIDTWIDFFEVRANEKVRTRDNECRVTATITSEYFSLPSDYLEMRYIKLNTNPEKRIIYATPQNFTANYAVRTNTSNNEPHHYTIVGDQVRLTPVPSSQTIEMVYWAEIPALSASNTSNWLLTKKPDLYLYGSLLHSAPYIRDDKRIQIWEAYTQASLDSLDERASEAVWSGGPLTIESDFACP